MHAQIVLFDGFDPLDVIAPYEVLYAGGAASDGAVSVELVSAEGAREVVSGTGGLTSRATAALDPARPGVVLVLSAVRANGFRCTTSCSTVIGSPGIRPSANRCA